MSDLIEKAKQFATNAHKEQTRKGAIHTPYIVHVSQVTDLVTRFGRNDKAIIAAWLHDVIEDCPPISYDDLVELFGDEITNIVREVTDDKSLPKIERKKLQIVNASKKSPEACLIKIADKICNIQEIISNPPVFWDVERQLNYVHWSKQVVSELKYQPEKAMKLFYQVYEHAKIELSERDLSK